MTLDYLEDELLAQMAAEKILSTLSEEERALLEMCISGAFTLEEIGRTIGQAYHGKDLKASVIRYHRDKILTNLRVKFNKGSE